MEKETASLIVALIALLGVIATIFGNYRISKRQSSKSGARVLSDMNLLEKARAMQLDQESLTSLEAQVKKSIRKHTHSK